MNHILNIALNDLRIFFSSRGNLVGLTVIPIFMTIALGIAFGGSVGSGASDPVQYRIDVIDNDNSERSIELISHLQSSAILVVCPLDERCALDGETLDLDTAIQRVEDEIITALLVIPDGFEAGLQAFEDVNLTYYTNESLQSGNPVGSAVNSVIDRMNSAVVAGRVGALLGDELLADDEQEAFTQSVYQRATTLMNNESTTIRYVLSDLGEQSDTSVGTGFGQSVPGIGAMQVLFTVLGGLVILIRERQQWTLQRLAVMPLTRSQILAGKILTYFLLGMIQYAILLVVGLLVGVDYGDSILAMVLLVSAFVLCVTALTFALATRVTSEGQANSLATLLGLILAPLGGAWWPLMIVPDFMQVIGHLSPVAWVMDGFNDLIFFGGGLIEILPEVGVLLVASAVLFVIGVQGFRYEG